MRALTIIGLAALLGFATLVHAEERPEHFSGEPAPDLQTAVNNLAAYNDKLRAILDKEELEPADYARIHELSYTLENALERIRKEVHGLAVPLEAIHQSSERMDEKGLRVNAPGYLSTSDILTGGAD
ncbi:hypothetical protein H0Z60_20485 [Ectothiorhodospiraceae bacterium WFHF3C12]|nr:hypothetical protein [Ectothiorhodospiraceae bacterium WFHF3C12]